MYSLEKLKKVGFDALNQKTMEKRYSESKNNGIRYSEPKTNGIRCPDKTTTGLEESGTLNQKTTKRRYLEPKVIFA
jgi:hypothetical protein